MTDIVLSLLILAAIALVLGAVFVMRKTGDKRQAVLMVVLAVIAAINVAIWTVPDAQGDAPVDQIDRIDQDEPER